MKLNESPKLLHPGALSDSEVERLLKSVGFDNWQAAHTRLLAIAPDDETRTALEGCLPMLLMALGDAATPDGSLVNFDRFAQSVPDRAELFHYLTRNPRAVEILVKLFVGSQFLTEILLRNPSYLRELTQHKRLAEFKSRPQLVEEAHAAAATCHAVRDKLDAMRRFQHWELLRIGACDSFGLMDHKTVTIQLSLLADSIVQSCLALLAADLDLDTQGFTVLAFGKLGGEELNYSSDIDLVFVAEADAARFWTLGQRLIKALIDATAEGFFYRVDMRLRPWGGSGALVASADAYLDYLKKHGMQWEKQALLKARPIAGDLAAGEALLKRVEPIIFSAPVDVVRESVREMKSKIEAKLRRQGRKWGEVKSGAGSIRDIEFVTQFLQLAHGGSNPHVRSINTLDGLVRLADFGFLQADEYRQLSNGYLFLRTVEHALQLMHYKQTHSLPESKRELAYLARRLDFPNAEQFLAHYERHCAAIRAVYDKYIGGSGTPLDVTAAASEVPFHEHIARMEPSYSKTFTDGQIERHAQLLEQLTDDNVVEVDAQQLSDNRWLVTLVGFDHPGDLSMICGLLFVYGFDIVDGNVFTDEQVANRRSTPTARRPGSPAESASEVRRKFVNVFTVRPPLDLVLPEVWSRYKQDLSDLLKLALAGRLREARGQLAKRVAGALRESPGQAEHLPPVTIDIDNKTSPKYTVLHIRAQDTIGFLYELTNALSMAGIDISRVIVSSAGHRVLDTLYVTDDSGGKITDPDRQHQLRVAVVLIKHFTHLLPNSPNPEAALLHFREFLEQMFHQPEWLEDLASLERHDVLDALARLLGASNFLWEDFLRLQHDNLFPVVKDVEALAEAKSQTALEAELAAELEQTADFAERKARLNAFKDREMFRADMRHILGHVEEFGRFSEELTNVAEVVVAAACEICDEPLRHRYGIPQLDDDRPCRLSVCALGKCGGSELGFASDIELMFIYEGLGNTTGPEVITTQEYFLKLVESFTQIIEARREGIFQIDLRLRPYGRAGSLAVSFDAFQQYFGPEGAAWPYERQALVKLRPIAGDEDFGGQIAELRDQLLYTEGPFDVAAMRAMREKQIRQLVQAGTVNAKLGPGGLVDTEYLVQGLQITYGHRAPALRTTNTCEALSALKRAGILSATEHQQLLEAYRFQRRLIDALRVVRGHARDLTVPKPDSEEFEFLARRLGYDGHPERLHSDLDHFTALVMELTKLLERTAAEGRRDAARP